LAAANVRYFGIGMFDIPNDHFACQVGFRSIKRTRAVAAFRGSMSLSLREKLRDLRQQRGMSLDELAKLSESSKSYLWELENRDARKPSAEKLQRIADVLGVTTDYLLNDSATMDDGQMKEAFFRRFNRLEADDKRRIEEMIEAWGKKK
jgi:transcriptional regulator with XRE-family HTH domain